MNYRIFFVFSLPLSKVILDVRGRSKKAHGELSNRSTVTVLIHYPNQPQHFLFRQIHEIQIDRENIAAIWKPTDLTILFAKIFFRVTVE